MNPALAGIALRANASACRRSSEAKTGQPIRRRKEIMSIEPDPFRTVILVRHGQYTKQPGERLTILGAEQARLTATTLKDLEIDRLFCSNMPRAEQTAKIIGKSFRLEPVRKKFFRESMLREKLSREVADEAYEFLFKTPARGQSIDLVVAHGNVIRYWVCKTLGTKADRWLDLDIHQCSLTTLRVDGEGRIKVLGFADIGHVPRSKRTYI